MRYVAACAALKIVPLSHSDLLALIEALLERAGSTIQSSSVSRSFDTSVG